MAPWRSEWVEPGVACRYKGVKVYHTYRHDDVDDNLSHYWFTLDPDSDEHQFDVRDLPTWENSCTETGALSDIIIGALRQAIKLGYLKKIEREL